MKQVLRVLVVDDSAYVRKVIKQMLSRSPFIEVIGSARDHTEALALVDRLNPDVVTLDLMMPGEGGIGFLKEQMSRRPIPVVVVSIAEATSELVLDALDAGATDFVQKPSALATEKMFEMSDELIEKVKAAATVKMRKTETTARPIVPLLGRNGKKKGRFDIVVIGISTGGPQALKQVIPRLPKSFEVPIAIVLHMPVGYTDLYAQRLEELSQLSVGEAQHGERVEPGKVLIAPAGRHLKFVREAGGSVVTHLDAVPFDTLHRPSVDVLFRSAAEIFEDRVLAIVMTGMGTDGKEGASWIKAKGGTVFTEAEASCVVYGMPRAVFEAGLSDRVISLELMAEAIEEAI
jgi:two-component system, chemotaxis family, protein-glutamate methylesterase/glutaminase